ncbi:MAG: PaaX family transcriptional regulator C-terminal domain-containing protein [Actinomycetota bacterium]
MPGPTPPSRAFVLGLADADGHVEAGALFELGAAVGLSTTSVRLAVRRLVDSGLATSDGRGREAVISLTPAGLAQRAPDLGWTALSYRLDHNAVPWDRQWYLVSFSVPESARTGRDALRDYLTELVGAPLAGGLYVSHYDWRPWVHAAATRHAVASHVTTASTGSLDVGGERDPRAIAARLWPLAELGDGFDAFVGRWGPILDDPPTDLGGAARVVFAMSHDFEELVRRDPVLPAELAPPAWRGAEFRAVYRRVLATLSANHPTVARANVFSAYLASIAAAETMDDATFERWFWHETNPAVSTPG